ncbi:MAG: integrase core domain-containing protein, partial [Actinomycetota bacterium]|nr:integrase core domain-containing protein [Actinomycetota bacterium]
MLRPPLEPEQYTALRFFQRLAHAGITASMGSTGDSFDNAMAESFFGTIKTELLYRQRWATRHDADMAIFDWIEAWYNPRRTRPPWACAAPRSMRQTFTPTVAPPSRLEPNNQALQQSGGTSEELRRRPGTTSGRER